MAVRTKAQLKVVKGEKDYLAIARQKVYTPSMKPPKWRFLIYSRNKKGKTTFCMSAGKPNVLIADPEYGVDKYVKTDPYVWPITKWEDTQDLWGALRTGQLSPKILGLGPEEEPFKWVALDGMTKINNYALRYIMSLGETTNLDRKPGIVDRRDYNKSGELIKELVLKFDALDMGVIYTAQERMITTSNDGADEDETAEASTFFVADLPAGARGTVNSVVDVIGRLYVRKVEFKRKGGGDTVTKNQRRLWLDNHPMYDTGGRSDYELPEFIKNPTVPLLVETMLNGSSQTKN